MPKIVNSEVNPVWKSVAAVLIALFIGATIQRIVNYVETRSMMERLITLDNSVDDRFEKLMKGIEIIDLKLEIHEQNLASHPVQGAKQDARMTTSEVDVADIKKDLAELKSSIEKSLQRIEDKLDR